MTLLTRSLFVTARPLSRTSFYPKLSSSFPLQTRPASTNTALISRLRKETQAPLTKVKEALELHSYDYDQALSHVLATQSAVSAKLTNRVAKEGAVGVWVSPCATRAAMVEVNCETDFVARSEEFGGIVGYVRQGVDGEKPEGEMEGVVGKKGLFSRVETGKWGEDETVKMGIGRLREKISVRRAVKGVGEKMVFGGYAHGYQENMGRIGAIVALSVDGGNGGGLGKLARQVAQQIVGFGPVTIEGEGGEALLDQDFLFGGGKVGEVVEETGRKEGVKVRVEGFVRFECGEGIVKEEGNFAEEVRRQVEGGNKA